VEQLLRASLTFPKSGRTALRFLASSYAGFAVQISSRSLARRGRIVMPAKMFHPR